MESLPEINLKLNAAKDTAKKTAKQATSSLKAAGSLVAKKTERTKLVTVTLPRAYAELGKSVYKEASQRDEFTDLFQNVDALLAERKRIADEGKARPAGTTVTDKAKKIAADAADMAKTKAVDLQAFQAFAKLGAAVFQQYGDSAGDAETVEPIAKAIARRDALDRELGAITSSAKGKWITPKRLAWGVGIFVGLGVLGNLLDRGDGGNRSSSTSNTEGIANHVTGKAFSDREMRALYQKAKTLRLGMPEHDVLSLLGTPTKTSRTDYEKLDKIDPADRRRFNIPTPDSLDVLTWSSKSDPGNCFVMIGIQRGVVRDVCCNEGKGMTTFELSGEPTFH